MRFPIGAHSASARCISSPKPTDEKTEEQFAFLTPERKTVIRIHGLRHLLCRSRSEEGTTLVEFAFAFLVFIFVGFAVIDFGHVFFVKTAVQNALQEAARYGSTGNHLPDPANPGNTLSRIASIENTLQNDAMGVNITNISISSVNLAGVSDSTSAGGPGSSLTVSVTVNVPLWTPVIAQLFPNGQYTFASSVTIMNEPFLPGLTN
jgi:Flp pilus assembly protein TadG